jgi:CRP/FNR family transcriptional regulator
MWQSLRASLFRREYDIVIVDADGVMPILIFEQKPKVCVVIKLTAKELEPLFPEEGTEDASLLECRSCPIAQYSIYRPSLKSSPERISSLRTNVGIYKPHATILHQGRPSELFGSLRSGWAYSYTMLKDGHRAIQGFLVPGDTVVLDLLFIGSNPLSLGVKALTTASVCWFPRESMSRLMMEEQVQRETTQFWASYYQLCLSQRAAAVGHSNARAKVALLILELVTRLRYRGIEKGDGYDFPLTQNLIADCLGLTTVHVNRVLREFQRRGLLVIRDKSIRILDERELVTIAEE